MRTGKVTRIADRVRVGRGDDVLTDGAPAYVKPLAELGANLTQASADGHAINRVNTLHARLEDFMFGFHGVSTKYLQAYLDWFQWLVAFTDGFGETDDDRLLARQLGNGLYRIRRRDYQRIDAAVHGVLAKSRMTSCIRCTVRTSKHRTRRRVWRAYPPRP